MLKERKARLLPQAMAEEQRRVDRSSQHGRSNQLCQVVERDERRRADLKMKLEAGVARFHHHVVVHDLKLVHALYVN